MTEQHQLDDLRRRLIERSETVAKQLRQQGPTAVRLAPHLARGYPAATMGDGRRSGGNSSAVERVAFVQSGTWDGAARSLLVRLWVANRALDAVSQLVTKIAARAGDEDPLPAGSGDCLACDKPVRTDRGDEGLRRGYCAACYKRWLREGRPDSFAFRRDLNNKGAA